MTAQIRSVLKAAFEQGDAPQGSDYADMIDSAANLAETTAQAFAGEVQAPVFVATTKVSAPSIHGNSIVGSTVSGGTVNANTVNTSVINITADTSVSHVSRASASGFIRVIVQNSIVAWLPYFR